MSVKKRRERRPTVRKERHMSRRTSGVVIDHLKQSDVVLPAGVATYGNLGKGNTRRDIGYLAEREIREKQ